MAGGTEGFGGHHLYHFAFSFDLAELTFDRTFPAIIYFAILFDLDTEDLSFAVPSTSLGQCCQTDFISCGSVGLVDRIGLAFVVYTSSSSQTREWRRFGR